ncbi:unnamed protein product [Ambrosiozyma monospora]|uniref:Unnamed protein product n=1 Tax=Ambrosiozyma monospora TaxID=43982 RepID=A0ACB5T3M0_AMBMO|nr:unnamed protein product [Ambrosiozyma monospora]
MKSISLFLKLFLTLGSLVASELALLDDYDEDLATIATAAVLLDDMTNEPGYYYNIDSNLYSSIVTLADDLHKPITAHYDPPEKHIHDSLEDCAMSYFNMLPMMDKVSMLPKITSYYVDVYSHSYGCPPIVPGYTGNNYATITATQTKSNAGGPEPTGFDYQAYGNRFQRPDPNLLLRHQG